MEEIEIKSRLRELFECGIPNTSTLLSHVYYRVVKL